MQLRPRNPAVEHQRDLAAGGFAQFRDAGPSGDQCPGSLLCTKLGRPVPGPSLGLLGDFVVVAV